MIVVFYFGLNLNWFIVMYVAHVLLLPMVVCILLKMIWKIKGLKKTMEWYPKLLRAWPPIVPMLAPFAPFGHLAANMPNKCLSEVGFILAMGPMWNSQIASGLAYIDYSALRSIAMRHGATWLPHMEPVRGSQVAHNKRKLYTTFF